jgi:hypothetical protein
MKFKKSLLIGFMVLAILIATTVTALAISTSNYWYSTWGGQWATVGVTFGGSGVTKTRVDCQVTKVGPQAPSGLVIGDEEDITTGGGNAAVYLGPWYLMPGHWYYNDCVHEVWYSGGGYEKKVTSSVHYEQ